MIFKNKIKEGTIVFFDGVCGLCNASVDFLIREDTTARLKYSPLQGETIKKYSSNVDIKNLNTLYVWNGERMLSKSEAWVWLMSNLGGLWTLLSISLKIVPLSVLDLIYDYIARNRYKFFGQRDTCRLPSATERKLFLD
jgi:predicted DCC family thiol-disulfide oxidoreductase YuxK